MANLSKQILPLMLPLRVDGLGHVFSSVEMSVNTAAGTLFKHGAWHLQAHKSLVS